MKVLLLNPPHTAIGSRIPDDHLPPLGLLALGGPLLDAGHDVQLLDADRLDLPIEDIVAEVVRRRPQAVLLGHSGSTSAHPTVAELSRRVRAALPETWIVYGGPFPTYHWAEVLRSEPQIDVVVRGEGEATVVRLLAALEAGQGPGEVPGVAFVQDGEPVATPPAPVIRDLDAWRVGWELIDHRDYSYWGGRRAVVVQFSRGCPHSCTYCGQAPFWTRWRHRDPVRFAAEIARLYREEGVEVFNFADENPTASQKAWRAFLEALIAADVPVRLVGSTRADDIVRDADILHLYKRAGVERFLLGTESTDEATLLQVSKGGSVNTDREAIRLLREHGILSMATWVVGFEDENHTRLWRGLQQLLSYDPDQIQALYVTPHRWTGFFEEARDRQVLQTDARRWDYKHQVLDAGELTPAQLFAWVKLIEVVAQARPRALKRLALQRDPRLRHAMRWYYQVGRRVWFHEVAEFLWERRPQESGLTLEAFWGEAQEGRLRRRRSA